MVPFVDTVFPSLSPSSLHIYNIFIWDILGCFYFSVLSHNEEEEHYFLQ